MFSEALEVAFRAAISMRMQLEDPTGCSHDIEILRRCWWTLRKLSYHRVHSPQSEAEALVLSFDVTLPLNVNDVDLISNTLEMPKPRHGATEMSFFLNDLEIARLIAGLKLLDCDHHSTGTDIPSRVQRTKLVESAVRKIERNALRYSNVSRPLDWFLLLTSKVSMVGRIQIFQCP